MRRLRLVFAAGWGSAACGDGDRPGRVAAARRLLWISSVLGWVVVVVVLAACSGGESPCSSNDGGGGDSDGSVGSVSDEDLCPPARGQPSPGFPGTYLDGSTALFNMPAANAALIDWSDWCFFDVAGTGEATPYECATLYATMAIPLELLGMAQDCVLAQARSRIEALALIKDSRPGAAIAAATGTYGWHQCPSDADPFPTPGKTLQARCESHTEFAAWALQRHGGCQAWASHERESIESVVGRTDLHDCILALTHLVRWVRVIHGETRGYLWQC